MVLLSQFQPTFLLMRLAETFFFKEYCQYNVPLKTRLWITLTRFSWLVLSQSQHRFNTIEFLVVRKSRTSLSHLTKGSQNAKWGAKKIPTQFGTRCRARIDAEYFFYTTSDIQILFKKIPSKNIDFKNFHAQDYFTSRSQILKNLSLEMIKMIENLVQTLKRPFTAARPSYELRFGEHLVLWKSDVDFGKSYVDFFGF